MSNDPTAVVNSLHAHLRPAILEHFSPDSCVASVRVGIDALAYFGIRAVPVPVRADIYNGEAVAALNEGGLEGLREALWKHGPNYAGGAWSLSLGDPNAANAQQAGHVILAIPAMGVLMDPSLDQASRPHKNLTLTPLIGFTDVERLGRFLSEPDQSLDTTVEQADDSVCVVTYYHQPQHLYRASPNWKGKSAGHPAGFTKALTGQIIRQMRADLAVVKESANL